MERGPALDERVKAVEHFSTTGELDENANIQFGEGGAGTFSDGKLTTRIGDELCGFVTEVFLEHGAPKEIAWQQKPHVGTDLLRGVITSIRKEIESLGGEVHFNTALTGFERRDGQLVGIQTTDGAFPCDTEQAEQAQRRRQLSGPGGEGLPARRRAELSAVAGLGTRGRAGDLQPG